MITGRRGNWSLCWPSSCVSCIVFSRFTILPPGAEGGLRSLIVALPGDIFIVVFGDILKRSDVQA